MLGSMLVCGIVIGVLLPVVAVAVRRELEMFID
jgi:hypothetical protein